MKRKGSTSIRCQSRITGRRARIYGRIPPEYLQAAERLARQHHCTVAFVLTTALADTIGLDAEERFDRLIVVRKQKRRAA